MGEVFPLSSLRLCLDLSLGLVVGSFLNVVILRLPEGASLVTPRSHCPHCQQTVRWYDNIPIVSYLYLRGKCRFCHERISIQYPLVELLTGVLFVAESLRQGGAWAPLLLRSYPFLAILICITFIDLKHRVIPDVLSLGGLVLGLLTFWIRPDQDLLEAFGRSFGGAVLGFSFFYSLAWLYSKMRGRMGLGGGDIKLLAMLGAFLGPTGVLVTICVSSISGSFVGLIWAALLRKNAHEKTGESDLMQFAIPFGPFLVIGALLYYFLGDVLWYLYTNQI